MSEERMSGLQKAAILLIALGPEKSAMIFKHLKEEEIEELKFFNIAEVELDNISPPIRPVVKRFIEQNS